MLPLVALASVDADLLTTTGASSACVVSLPLLRDLDFVAPVLFVLGDELCKAVLAISGHAEMMDSDLLAKESVRLRNPYVDPLNYIQVEMLRRLRALPDQKSPEAQQLHEIVVLTINGIAAGLRNTG